MARSILVAGILALGHFAQQTNAERIRVRQPQVTSTPTNRGAVKSISSTRTPTTTDVPEELLSIANSLISENYSGQTVSNIRTLSWPTTVVIGSQTYTISPDVTAGTSSQGTSKPTAGQTTSAFGAQQTNTEAATTPNDQKGDKRLAIILGVVLGVVALAIMAVIFFCLHRRKKDNGSFFLRRTTPSMRSNGSRRSSQIRPEMMGNTAYISAEQHDPYQHKYPETNVIQRGNTPPIMAHPAYMQPESSRSTSEENPFYTPLEYAEANHNPHELDSHQIQEVDYAEPVNRRSSSSVRDSRPPTPFSPLMMMQMPGPAAQPQIHQNPFVSPEDDEADDLVSPIMPPARNPNRRYSPIVHYPSWDEVSAFSFSGDERDGRVEEGGDGWRPQRDSRDGRYELA